MTTGQAIAIAIGFVAAVFAIGMGASMFADWLRAKDQERRRASGVKEAPAPSRERLLERALVYSAHLQHAMPLHMLPKGVTLIDADGVTVTLPSGEKVEAFDRTAGVLASSENWPDRSFNIGDKVLIPGGRCGVVKGIDAKHLKRYHVMTSETQGGMFAGFELEPADGVKEDLNG